MCKFLLGIHITGSEDAKSGICMYSPLTINTTMLSQWGMSSLAPLAVEEGSHSSFSLAFDAFLYIYWGWNNISLWF